jgi:hypothetical protein
MREQYDWSEPATLLEKLPPDKNGSPQYRELITGDLRRCFEYARKMTAEARSIAHIELNRGGRIEVNEFDAFSDERGERLSDGGKGPAPGISDAMSIVKLT